MYRFNKSSVKIMSCNDGVLFFVGEREVEVVVIFSKVNFFVPNDYIILFLY